MWLSTRSSFYWRLIDLKDRSKWNNLKVDDIKHRPNQTGEDSGNELNTLFKESLGIEEKVVIERAHRVRADKSKKGNTPRTIVCRILNYKEKVKILRNAKKLKGKSIFINDNFCQATLDYLKGGKTFKGGR